MQYNKAIQELVINPANFKLRAAPLCVSSRIAGIQN